MRADACPSVAVVLCTHNGVRFLDAQLASLRAQSRHPDEYVLSDDASTDGTWERLQAFAAAAMTAGRRVVLHRNPSALGYVRHFEQALQRATAEVVFPCDQDDVWHADKLARMAAEFARRPGLQVLHADARLVDAEGRDLGRSLFDVLGVTPAERVAMHAGRGFDVLLRRNIVTGAAMALRRGVVAMAQPFPAEWAHDEWMAMLAAMHGDVDTLDGAVIDYRQHGGNQIGVRERGTLAKTFGIDGARPQFMARMAARLQVLADRADAAGNPVVAASVRERLAHARVRASLPPGFPARVPRVWREWRTGRYGRFGSGWRSALVDALGVR